MLIAGLRVHEEERLAGRFGGPHPTGEPERRAEDSDRSARPGRSHITQAFRSTYCDVPRICFLGPPFVSPILTGALSGS